ncbi:hypothetical protein [Turneriella parva]|uniref:DUF1285 domain-containing protein n=1 Tax=Turneriella parva (strain ATCC BAA-1111 / DSM 21527 / NCTC 11395 / H) TaxID=869212 RepID=I4B7J4_TURPD|nr:hypothetical protein [Turneriella parva]AFM13251.1 hypothetical protein Turpa_2611 [Turneriella parva DSM 21527]
MQSGHETAREEFTNIRVARDGRWFTGAKEIINFKVISHFKQNLFRDAKGVYIYQTFRQFAEKGYITVEGPLLSVFRIDGDTLIFDSLDAVPLDELRVVLNSDDESPYIYYDRLGCYANVPAGVAPYFSERLEQQGDLFTFCGKPVELRSIAVW